MVPANGRDHAAQWFDVLVVDDDDALATLAARSLLTTLDGVRVEREVDPRIACRWALRRRFGVIVVDYAMPHMTGRELIATVRQQRPDQPFIVLSGHDRATLRELFAEYQDVPLLSKWSTDYKHLVAHVEEIRDADLDIERPQAARDAALRQLSAHGVPEIPLADLQRARRDFLWRIRGE